MTSLGKKTAPHWFLPVPEVSQSAGQPSPYFPKKTSQEVGGAQVPTAWCGWWAVGGKEATCDRNAALPSTCPAPRSHFRVRGSVHNCGGIQPASTHASTPAHTHTQDRVPCTLEHSCTECARGAVRQSGAGWRWGRACSGGFVPLVPLLLLGRESGNQGRRNRTTGRRRGRLGDKERV